MSYFEWGKQRLTKSEEFFLLYTHSFCHFHVFSDQYRGRVKRITIFMSYLERGKQRLTKSEEFFFHLHTARKDAGEVFLSLLHDTRQDKQRKWGLTNRMIQITFPRFFIGERESSWPSTQTTFYRLSFTLGSRINLQWKILLRKIYSLWRPRSCIMISLKSDIKQRDLDWLPPPST